MRDEETILYKNVKMAKKYSYDTVVSVSEVLPKTVTEETTD